ncbi:MAG: CHASE2 domain-containing protein [Parvibaculaceae bacterium]|nr:CHASE2 domain-containing protein [Parvibaculaceae bacterium]HBM88373.1 CHASE2 domain-containing protein [Rhodobiaceae bacterium]|tara:strand:+ start:3690 stop:5906 length:2217 start_codon:yes stop_codon:yes gene_type:complete
MKTYRQTIIVGCLALLLGTLGVLEPIERALLGFRFNIDTRPASRELVVVQIDARTINKLGVWPFNRADHAKVIDALHEAGASAIAFDVELARSPYDEENTALVEALKRAGGQVILPSFIQLASAGQKSGETLRTEPDPLFREHSWLANVNVYPSSDGRIWTMTYGGFVDDKFQYSLAATLAGRALRDEQAFYVDYGIEINSIPRLSYIDLLTGDFDPADIRGKRIIVGGTAVELGDQLNLPIIGVVSGPVLQALAFETIHQQREIWRTSTLLSLMLAALTLLLLSLTQRLSSLGFYLLGILVFCASVQLTAFGIQHFAAISVDTGAILLVAGLMGISVTTTELEARREQVARERVEKENHGRMLDRVVEDSFDGIIVYNQDRRIESGNAAARKILQVQGETALVGQKLSDVLPNSTDWWAPWEQDRVENLQEVEFPTPSGETRIIEYVVTRSVLEEAENIESRPIFTATFRDITERRQAELDRDDALQEAIAANRSKTQFLANMSHELRTPLNAIIGFSEIMKTEAFGPLGSEQYVGYSNDIEDSGRHLLSIVNDILDVARIETGDFSLNEDELEVEDLLQSVKRLTEGWPAAKDRNIKIDAADGLPDLWADARLTKQMVLNLLSNAVKFSPSGSTILLKANVNDSGAIRIDVCDEGIGIPEESIPKLTDAFFQVDARLEREFEGSGLGLTLVQRHMALHGGTLSFESKEGVGTTATLTFPSDRSIEPDAASSNEQSA